MVSNLSGGDPEDAAEGIRPSGYRSKAGRSSWLRWAARARAWRWWSVRASLAVPRRHCSQGPGSRWCRPIVPRKHWTSCPKASVEVGDTTDQAVAKTLIDPAAYSLGKAVLSHLVRILDLELRPHGIGVNAVAPQLLDTSRNRAGLPGGGAGTRRPAGSGRGHHRLPRQRPGRTRQRCGRVGLRRLARPHHTLHLPCI